MRRLSLLLVLPLLAACATSMPVPAPSSAPPAATDAARDPHSYARPDEVRVEHIALSLAVDFARKQLVGTATLRVRNAADFPTLVLDTNGLDIRSVRLEPSHRAAQFHLGNADPILGRPLEIAVDRGTTDVVIDYATDPGARALQWLEPQMTAGKSKPFLLSQSQAILARSWVPCQDTPSVRFTYDATLRVAPDLLAVMSAAGNPQSRSADGIYRFHMPQPIPSYLLAIAVGDLDFRTFDDRSGVYAERPVVDAAAREFSDTPKMIAAAEALYGPYRWGRYDLLVLPPSFPYGGMENPRLTFLTPTVIAGDRSLVSLIAHELAHSWSGNLVTNATWSDFWLNEGVTTYIEHRLVEQLYGRPYAEMQWQLGIADAKQELATLPPSDQGLYVPLAGRDPDDAPGTVYEKGALFLRLLEETAGRDRWDAFLRSYFETFAFQPMTTARFETILREKLPDVVEKVDINAWIHGPGIPANAPRPYSEAFLKVEEAASRFASGTAPESLGTASWSSHEWVHFIQSLPPLTAERMAALDASFHFSESGNSEALFAWLQKSIDAHYAGARPAIERFLTSQGRRKFVKPLFEKLAKNRDDLEFAKQIYAKARPTYHPVTRGTVDEILGVK